MANQRVGVLGSGEVGQVLGAAFASLGHEVKIGTRDPRSDKLKKWQDKAGKLGTTGTFEETAKFAELIVFAPLGTAAEGVIGSAGGKNFAGKVVIDATNPLNVKPNAPPTLFVGRTDSLGER